MASRPKFQVGQISFANGQNSSADPIELPPTQYARAMNVVNRGNIVQCRPGYRCMFSLPDGYLQGFTQFRPLVGGPILVAAVDGKIYGSLYPFREFFQVEGLQFSPIANQLFFKQVQQTVQTNEDGSLTLISPRNLLVIQDGALTKAGIFDGGVGEHVSTIPVGGPMEWVGDRLWIARGSQLFASDLANPVSFVEPLYITGVESFIFSETITAMAKTPTAPQPSQLLIFTANTTNLIQAGIRDRTLWPITPDFQREIFSNIGCVSARSVATHYGFLNWFSRFGLTSMDVAAQSFVSSELPYEDGEMEDSKARLSSDLSTVACGTFENYLLVSVPHADKFNRHTWVLDNSVRKTSERERPAWNGYWTGTRPVEWASGIFAGENRIFYASVDYDGQNRVWEAFQPERLDEGCPITWFVETRGLAADGFFGKYQEFIFADIFLAELQGVVDIGVYWAGAHRGKYKRILTKRISAARGSLRHDQTFTANSKIFGLKKQSRKIRTQEAKELAASETLSSCDVEDAAIEFRDDSFQLLIVGSGPGAVRGYIANVFGPHSNEDQAGRCETNETEENFVRFDGAAADATDFDSALSQFEADIPVFESVQTTTLIRDGESAVGLGAGESIISQDDADKIALAIATRKAAVRLEKLLAPVVSKGGLVLCD